MTLLDKSDEELAQMVISLLNERMPRELYGFREWADVAPVSRGTLHRWEGGQYGMRKNTRRKVVEWLDERQATPPPEDVAGRFLDDVNDLDGENGGGETENDVA